MKLCTVFTVFTVALVWSSVSAQKVAIVERPDNSVKPAHILLYRSCGTNQVTLDIVTQEGYATIRCQRSDRGITVTLCVERKRDDAPLSFRTGPQIPLELPQLPCTMNVILYADTAVLRIDSQQIHPIRQSPQLIIDTASFIPHRVMCVQLHGQTPGQARKLRDSVAQYFGPSVAPVIIPSGIYPCLPTPWVSHLRFGRRSGSANKTNAGILICFEIPDAEHRTVFADWVVQRQGEVISR